ncbi:nicotinamide-nucleotide amidohydrolase family protein [Sulfobacillus harzensis]|uniref:Putative competence-damage inducible protein n=1 Tax=Sulfobacillus harzensis TaxID=2729629 RepID=A0A7Y0L2R6_9FIRM|nr:nicotinamide-nucleotide amidohydrolase family protein [Sulfobacillus harzensis]NMP20814.1 nicotinamide-nucleotide amidohydrolase family protein [Sulfobacillus harzensis]
MLESAQIIAVGDEVLAGETVNTNGAWMAQFLMTFGIRPSLQYIVPDSLDAIEAAVRRGLVEADLVITIGGLGPTADDRTVEACGRALCRPLTVDEVLLERIRSRHSHTAGWEASARRQARVLEGALLWPNPRGQAPGQAVAEGSGWVILLPGPPREMQAIAETHMGPWLRERSGGTIHRDAYTVFDLGESAVATHLGPLLSGHHPKTGIYAQPGRVDVRIDTDDSAMGRVLRERSRAWVMTQIPAPVYELAGQSREAYLIEWLAEHAMTIAAMESLTGGEILASLISIPGASRAVVGGVVAYTDAVKAQFGVSQAILSNQGAVSAACAEAMAIAIRERLGVDVGISSTGYAGPDGGDEENPVGTFYVAAAGPHGTVVRRRHTPLDRQAVRRVAAHTALSAVWELLKLPTLWQSPRDSQD